MFLEILVMILVLTNLDSVPLWIEKIVIHLLLNKPIVSPEKRAITKLKIHLFNSVMKSWFFFGYTVHKQWEPNGLCSWGQLLVWCHYFLVWIKTIDPGFSRDPEFCLPCAISYYYQGSCSFSTLFIFNQNIQQCRGRFMKGLVRKIHSVNNFTLPQPFKVQAILN